MSLPIALHQLRPIGEIDSIAGQTRFASVSGESFRRDDFLVTFGNAVYTVAVPLASEHPGQIFVAKIIQTGNSGSVTLNRSGADTIDGLTSFVFNGYNSSVMIQAISPSAWVIIGYFDGGYSASNIISVAVNTTVLTTGRVSTILVDTSGGIKTITLPKILENIGRKIIVKNIGANEVTVDANGAETIDGALTFPITLLNQSFTFQAFTTGWAVI